MTENRMRDRAGRYWGTAAVLLLVLMLGTTACGAAGAPAAQSPPTAPPSLSATAAAGPSAVSGASATVSAPLSLPSGVPATAAAAPTSAAAAPTKALATPAGAPARPANTIPAGGPTAPAAALNCTVQDGPAAVIAVIPASDGLTGAESTYLDQVDALVNRMSNSTELSAAALAMRDATQQYGLTGLVDSAAANQALGPAVSFMSGLSPEVSALQPPPGFKGVQDELQGAVSDVNAFLKDSQNAVANPSRDSMNAVQMRLLVPFGNLLVVTVDSSNRRAKAGMGLPQVGVDSPLTPAETAYLNQVQALINRMSNCPQLNTALSAFGDDLDKLNNTGQLDGKATNEARLAAIRFMNSLAPSAQALQPTARLQAVQSELLKAVQLFSNGYNDWQAAITDQKWDNLGRAFFEEVGAGSAVLSVLNKDLAFLGIK